MAWTVRVVGLLVTPLHSVSSQGGRRKVVFETNPILEQVRSYVVEEILIHLKACHVLRGGHENPHQRLGHVDVGEQREGAA